MNGIINIMLLIPKLALYACSFILNFMSKLFGLSSVVVKVICGALAIVMCCTAYSTWQSGNYPGIFPLLLAAAVFALMVYAANMLPWWTKDAAGWCAYKASTIKYKGVKR